MNRVYLKSELTQEQENLVVEWIKALRSGEYKQGKHALCSVVEGENRYCCLGVLCEVDPDIKKRLSLDGKEYYFYEISNTQLEASAYLPKSANIVLEDGAGHSKGLPIYSLPQLNDNKLMSFDKIASLLELDLKGELTLESYNQILQRS